MCKADFCSNVGMSLAIMVLALVPGAAWSQGYPTKPIEFVVHTSPGGGTDVFARAVTEMLAREKAFSQPLTVANRTGGGGTIAFNHIKSKRGDPHFVLTIATGSLLTAASRPDLDLGLETYTPLAFFALDPQVIAVLADSKFTNMKELIEAGRREPNAIVGSIASATGTGRQLLYAIERETGAKYKFVSFKSGAEAATAVLGGHVPFTTENLSEMFPHVEARKMRVLAVTGDKRLPAVPDAPTLKELGYQISVGTGRGFAMPAGVPRESAVAMETALKRVHDSQAWKDFSTKFMFEDMYMGSAEFAQFLVKRRQETQGFLEYIGFGKKP